MPSASTVIPGYTSDMKTAISLPEDTFEQATRQAAELGISRSEFFARAARRYLDDLASRSLTQQIDEALPAAARRESRGRRRRGGPQPPGTPGRLVIRRGSIWWADLGEPRGSKPARRRPVLVIQSGPFNASRLKTAVAAVITSTPGLAAIPGNVFLPATASGLPKDSVVNVTAIVTLDKTDLDAETGQLPASLMSDVDRGLRRVLGL